MGVLLGPEEEPAPLEVSGDLGGHVTRVFSLEPAIPLDISRHLVDRHEDWKLLGLRQREVFGAAAGRDMDHPGPLGLTNVLPRDHAVPRHALSRGWELLVERSAVPEADELAASDGLEHRRGSRNRGSQGSAGEDEDLIAYLRADILELRVDGQRDVRGKRPRGRRPHEERFVLPAFDREPDEDRLVRHLAV